MCFVNNTLFVNVGREKWGVVWGWEGDGLLVGQLDSASIGPKWSQARVAVSCSHARHLTLPVPLPSKECKWYWPIVRAS